MKNDTDWKLLKDCVKLAKDECACCQDGICLKNNLPCTQTLINKHFTLEAGALNCDEFMNGVLPAARELHEAVMNRLSVVQNLWDNSAEVSANMFLYTNCGQPFCRRCNSKKYCMYSNQQIHNTMNRIGSTINLHGATLHCLRHTFVTEAIASGMDIKSIATIAGHASTKMTFDRYAHPQKEQIFRACSSMDSYLKTLGNNAELLNPVKPA